MTENEAIERLECMRLFMQIEDERNESKFLEDDYIANEMAIQALQKVQQFEAIGTIDEFKSLKEKNVAKKVVTREEKYPQNYGIYSTADRWCPCCRGLVFSNDWGIEKQKLMYKRNICGCGQKLDWQ